MDSLISLDQQLFLALNGLHSEGWDGVMYWVTNKYTWIPLYLALLVFIARTTGKSAVYILLTVIAAVGLADFIASGLMKPYFMRPRPCHDPLIGHLVHTISGCGGRFGFSSSHASTSFGLATSVYLLVRPAHNAVWLLFLWALVYSYSRVYAGVHYPGDILAGALAGILAGGICTGIYSFFFKNRKIVH